MCQYCENLFTGDAFESLSEIEITSNNVSLLWIPTYLVDVGKYKHEKHVCLTTEVATHCGTTIICKDIEVHYCPICGRKFEEE